MLKKLTNFSFGGTSAIITNISIIVGLGTGAASKQAIIGSLLVIALADNISDSLGIHIYRESECGNVRETYVSTISNFFTRLVTSLSFVLIMLLFSIPQAQVVAFIWGLSLLGGMSYLISRRNGTRPLPEITRHTAIAIVVIAASKFIGYVIAVRF